MLMRILHNLVFIFLLFIFANLIVNIHRPTNPQFKIDNNSTIVTAESQAPYFESSLIPQPTYLRASHSAALTYLDNGQLLATWFAGSHEGKPDVRIWQSIFANNKWSMAHIIVSPESITHLNNLLTRKVGNPVIYLAQNGWLHLFVVSSIGGWSASSINHFISQDNGSHWLYGRRLILSPFFNLSNLVRANPISLVDGGFYLPVYHELIKKYPELLRFDKSGKFLYSIKLNNIGYLLQPSMLALTVNHAIIFLRNASNSDHTLYYQQTFDGGLHWQQVQATNLTNYDSSLAVAKILPHLYIMVHDLGHNRNRLGISISKNGTVWQNIYILEQDNDTTAEFSYPAISIHGDQINILYTWKRLAIKHVVFNTNWLLTQIIKQDKSE
jgi:predicted neuraminidase